MIPVPPHILLEMPVGFEFDGAMRTPLKSMLAFALSLGVLGGMAERAFGGLLELQVAYEQRVNEVETAHAAGMAKLDAGYLRALENLSAKAKQSGDLDKSLAIAAEIERATVHKLPPALASAVPELQKLMDTYREEAGKLGRERSGKLFPFASAYDKALEQLEKALVKDGDLKGAKAVRDEREARGKDLKALADEIANAHAFTNSLGMRFVPVEITGGPTKGKKVLFSVWETRRRDYEAYAKANPEVDRKWKTAKAEQGNEADHPVVEVSWEDAQAFCAWLTRVERDAKRIGWKDVYRLPSDHEWSCAIGIGASESAGASPRKKSEVVKGYPWGPEWPPPVGAGNYDAAKMEGYQDDFGTTAPVGSFGAGPHDLYDLSGNVWEWCEDWIDGSTENRVLRGGSWYGTEVDLRSSYRGGGAPRLRIDRYGFRCVLERSGG